jgi:hypothetical protein
MQKLATKLEKRLPSWLAERQFLELLDEQLTGKVLQTELDQELSEVFLDHIILPMVTTDRLTK